MPGPRIPLVHGSSPTEVCAGCGQWRTVLHVPGPWRSENLDAVAKDDSDPYE